MDAEKLRGSGFGPRQRTQSRRSFVGTLFGSFFSSGLVDARAGEVPLLRIATFQVDATPPLGSPLCNGDVMPARRIDDPLSARGIVFLFPEQKPVVLCAVDWVGIYNGGHDAWRSALAVAAQTTAERVSVHTLHQHDAPGFDLTAEEILATQGLGGSECNITHAQQVIAAAANALRHALKSPMTVTHVGVGTGIVEKFASNRRVMGPDGRVRHVRYSFTPDAAVRAAEEGTIDPQVRMVSFWDRDAPRAVLSYYATHPQSRYGNGGVSADTVGVARALRESALPGVAHIHFNGAAGNITAGKYNDGLPESRAVLGRRLDAGMALAWAATRKFPVDAGRIEWRVHRLALPLRASLKDEAPLLATLQDANGKLADRMRVANYLAWSRRVKAGHKIDVGCLHLGPAALLHLPGELFVEYQLAAQKLLPQASVCVAAYGDGGPGYIGTEAAYQQGGYETGRVSHVAPTAERELMTAMRELLAR